MKYRIFFKNYGPKSNNKIIELEAKNIDVAYKKAKKMIIKN